MHIAFWLAATLGVAHAVRPLPVLSLSNQNLVLSWMNLAVLGNIGNHTIKYLMHLCVTYFDDLLNRPMLTLETSL